MMSQPSRPTKARAKGSKPMVPGVPQWLLDYMLDRLEAGRATAYEQHELYKILVHKFSGRAGRVHNLTCIKSARALDAAIIRAQVRQEERRMKENGEKPDPGGYRATALEKVAKQRRWKSGEALGRWLSRYQPTADSPPPGAPS